MKLRKWWIILVVVGILTSAGVFFVKYNEGQFFTEGMITHVSKDLSEAFGKFFIPITEDINEGLGLISTGRFIYDRTKELHYRKGFSEFLNQHEVFSSIIYKGAYGDEFIIYKDRASYISSYRSSDTKGDSIFSWMRFIQADKILSQWNEVLSFNPKNEDWYEGSRENIQHNRIYWEGQYNSIFVNEPVFAGAIGWFSENDSKHNALAFEIPIRHLVSSLRVFNIYKHRRIFIISDDGEFIHIPTNMLDSLVIYDESNSHLLEDNDLLLNTIRENINLFDSKDENAIAFHYEGEKWWTQTTRIEFKNNYIKYGIAIPEDELLIGELKRIMIYLISTMFILFTAFFIYYRIKLNKINLKEKENESLLSNNRYQNYNWLEIVKAGENNRIEFKSTLRWDLREGKVNSKLEEVVLKSIAAFSNGEGGTLLIGVDDEGNILGLENDFKSLRKYGSDYFEIHLRNILNKQFGVSFSTSNLEILFPQIENKDFCVIVISQAEEPVFMSIVDKNGNKTEKFFVRSGNSSQEISSLKEINSYITKRFVANSP